jgi:ribonuclease BN (tRNA processing enzyme)
VASVTTATLLPGIGQVIEFEVLSSGSRGNAALLHLQETGRHVLIDAGISPSRTRQAMEARGRSHRDVTDVLLTHGDSDHLHAGWKNAIVSWAFTIHVHVSHVDRIVQTGIPRGRISAFESDIALDDVTTVSTIMAPHDIHGTVAYVIRHGETALGWATDLGRAEAALLSFFQGHQLDALAIESNYDRDMQLLSDRPPFLIERIMGGAGHLSNRQSLEAVLEIAIASELQHLVLLHRSEQCNCLSRINALWAAQAPHLHDRMVIASQDEASGIMTVRPSGALSR